jgi:hypothetical protein
LVDLLKKNEINAHFVAMLIAILGPLVFLLIGFSFTSPPPGAYIYWFTCLSIYVAILIPFTYKIPLTLVRLVILGITVEDFFSRAWRSLIYGYKFLPFCNWYTQHFPFLGILGEPTPLILIPRWYIVALFVYIIITMFQFRRLLMKKRSVLYIILILLIIGLVFLLLPQLKQEETEKKLWILGSNLGTWGVKDPGELDEPFVLNPVQRELAKGVIGTFRFNPNCDSDRCENGLLPENMLSDLLNKIDEVDAEPFCVLSMTNDTVAKYTVKLFKERVTYYEFGNEPDFVLGPAESYARKWNQVVPQLKRIDPNIKIGGPVVGFTGEAGKSYIKKLLELADPKPDFVSWHMYAGRIDNSNAEIINTASKWGDYIDEVENNVIVPTLGHKLPIVISEWNWNPLPEYDNDFRDEDKQFISNFTSTVLEEFKNNDNLLMAHQYCYGAHCANGHLAMLGGEWAYSDPKPQYNIFLQYAKILCPECERG